jgi:hypothetical protein
MLYGKPNMLVMDNAAPISILRATQNGASIPYRKVNFIMLLLFLRGQDGMLEN